MKQNKAIKLAYLAGVIDSDGSITISRNKTRRGTYSYAPHILVNLTDGRTIDWLYGTFGGNVFDVKNYNRPAHCRTVWRWDLHSQRALDVAKDLIPFLKYKKEQAQLLVQFGALIHRQMRNRPGRWNPLKPEEWEAREALYWKLRELKTEVRPSAAVTTKRSDPVNTGSDSLALQEEEL